MKNKIYLFGIILVILFTMGAIFKIQHWPGASVILVFSLGLFSLVFTPFAIISCYRAEKKYAFVYTAGLISVSFNFIGAMFKLMHWPGAGILLTIAIILPFVLFLPTYLIYLGKVKEKNIRNLVSVLFVLAYIASMDALLALNVSKNVIDDSVLVNDNYTSLTAYYENSIKDKLANVGSLHREDADVIEKKTEKLIREITELKKELIIEVNDGIEEGFDNIDIRDVKLKEDRSISSILMINMEKATLLKQSINEYRRFLNQITQDDKSALINKYLSTDDIEWEGNIYSWEEVHFNGTMLVWALNNLTSIELNIRMAEAEAVELMLYS